jgi:hypothetical protein
MKPAQVNVVVLPEEPRRIRRRILLATAARQRLDVAPSPRGRAWINGREAGGQDPRFAHLSRVHD